MNNLTEWWKDYQALTEQELEAINQHCPHQERLEDKARWEKSENVLRELVPMANTLKNHNLYVEENATSFINYLFDKYLDDETLLVTSTVEHDSVRKAVIEHGRKDKDHICFRYFQGIDSLNLSPIIEALQNKTYKRVFVYIIGTQITTGEWTPQKFYSKLKEYVEHKGLEIIMVIDDVHGLYLLPRDYSIFDYVISTAHALIRNWDMGLMWSKTPETYGGKYYNWLETYNELLKLMLDKQIKLSYFSQVMKEEFMEYLSIPFIELIPDSVPHIFSLKIHCQPKFAYTQELWQQFADNEVRLETMDYDNDNLFYIRMRGSQFITFPNMVERAIELTKQLLNKVIMLKDM